MNAFTLEETLNAARTRRGGNATVFARALHKSYRVGSVVTPVLRGVDLEVHADGVTVLAGPSGSGKTTLLNLVGLIDRADQGQLRILGTDVGTLTDNELSDFRRDHIGYVFQHFNLLPVFDARENVEHPLTIAGVAPRKRREMALAALDMVGLAAQAAHLPNQLSGGQRQRVAIARALVKHPALVIADEPTANLDSATGAEVMALMRSLQRSHGISFVVSSHDPQVQAQADRTLHMRDGRLEGTVALAAAPQPALVA